MQCIILLRICGLGVLDDGGLGKTSLGVYGRPQRDREGNSANHNRALWWRHVHPSTINDAAQYLLEERRTGRRRAILTITDNVGQGTISDVHVTRDLWEANAVLMDLLQNADRRI